MNWTAKKVLVTGADGFIGSHLAEALAAAGADVTALAMYNSFDSHGWLDDISADARDGMRLVRGDIRDAHQMRALVGGHDIVFHLAALIAIPYSYEAPGNYVDTNVHGTLNLLTAARECGVSRFVHTSTSEVYGTAQFTPITEAHPLQGQSPYSASKIGADMMADAFYRSFELPVVTLRPFNTYGPRQSERAVIPTIIRQAVDPSCAEIRVGDLRPTRDFNFVEDTVAAFMAVAGLADEHNGETFNAGTGTEVSIGDTLEAIRRACNTDKPVLQESHRKRPAKSEVFTLVADAGKLRAASSWTPATTLDSGIEKTVAWWMQRRDRLRGSADYMR